MLALGATSQLGAAGLKAWIRAWVGHGLRVGLSLVLAIVALRRRRSSRGAPTDAATVLIVRFDLMGDVVNGLAAAHAARRRWPEARIVFLTPPAWQPIVERCSAVDRTVAFDFAALTHLPQVVRPRAWLAALRALRGLRSERFDVAVSVYGPIAGTVVAFSGSNWRVGYATEAPRFAFDDARPGRRRNGGPHESALAAALVDPGPPTWRSVDALDGLPPMEALQAAGPPLLVAHPGAAHGQAKRWPADHWATALRGLQAQVGGSVAIVGLKSERPLAVRLARELDAVIDLTGRTTLDELMAVLHAADLVISTDSGPAHLARALGTRVLALHGPTDVSVHGPGDPRSAALRVELPCGPCYTFRAPADCAFGDVLCMHWLSPERVERAATALVAETRPHT